MALLYLKCGTVGMDVGRAPQRCLHFLHLRSRGTIAVEIYNEILKRGEVAQPDAATVIVVAILEFPHWDTKGKLVEPR